MPWKIMKLYEKLRSWYLRRCYLRGMTRLWCCHFFSGFNGRDVSIFICFRNMVMQEAKESFASPGYSNEINEWLLFMTLHVWDDCSIMKGQIKKLKTFGPPFLVGQQKLQKKLWCVTHRFRVKSGQSIGGVILPSPVIEVVRFWNLVLWATKKYRPVHTSSTSWAALCTRTVQGTTT